MTDDRLAGVFVIIAGLIFSVFADPIGRHHARLLKTNPRPHQMMTFFGGLLAILMGILILIFG